jgi:plasmid stabilization system protein ParE
MAYRVAWSPRAVEDLEAVAQYIAADSTASGATVVRTILNTGRNLSRFPFAGRVVPELGDENERRISELFVCDKSVFCRFRRTGCR